MKGVMEDLEKSIHLAEDICPGVTDKMGNRIVDKFQRGVRGREAV